MARQYLKQLQVANVERQRKAAVTLQRYVYKSTISSFATSKTMGTLKSRGILLGILGGDVPPGSPNPDHISDQKMSFSASVFRQDL